MNRWLVACVIGVAGMVGLELGARIAFDFPLYGADDEVGYWLLPDQRGAFLFTNDWAFNSDSLGVAEEFRPSGKLDVLLVGDSIVLGGNELRQSDKLGPLVASRTRWKVWPASAGSWGLQNELAFLRRKPHLVRGADIIVVIANSGDFGQPSEWRSEYTHPRRYPSIYLQYLFRRYVARPAAVPPAPWPVPQRDVLQDWTGFLAGTNKPVIAISYASQQETGSDCNWTPAAFRVQDRWICYDGLKVAGQDAFRDGIHPSAAGNRALAERIIALVEQSRGAE